MKKLWWILLFCGFVIVIVCGAQENNRTPVLHPFAVIRAGVLIDGKSDSPRRNQVIIIRGNRIESRLRCRDREDSRRRGRYRSFDRNRTSRPD